MELGGIGIGIDKMELTPCLYWSPVVPGGQSSRIRLDLGIYMSVI